MQLSRKKRVSRYILAFILFTVLFLFIYALYKITPFGDRSLLIDDMGEMFFEMMEYFRTVVAKNGLSSLLYTWSNSLGNSFIPFFAFLLSSPLLIIYYLLYPAIGLAALTVYSCVKCALCGVAMLWFIDRRKGYKDQNYIFALSYMLMGYLFTLNQTLIFVDSFIMLPICMEGIHRLAKNNSCVLLLISSAILMFSNFYSGYMVLLFCVIYYFYLIYTDKLQFHIMNFGRTILSMAIGCLVNAWMLLPSFLFIINNRAEMVSSSQSSGISTNALKTLFTGFWGFYDLNDTDSLSPIYCGVIILVFIVAYFTSRSISRRKKIGAAAMLSFFYLSYVIIFLNKIWHCFTIPKGFPNRFTFILIGFIITMASESFDSILSFSRKQLIIVFSIVSVILCGCLLLQKQYSSSDIILNIILLVIYALILFLFKKNRKIFTFGILVVLCFELCTNSLFVLRNANQIYKFNSTSEYNTVFNEKNNLISPYINDNSYRVADYNAYSLNDSFLFGTNGIASYTSTYKESTMTFLQQLGFDRDENILRYNGFTSISESLLGVKYILNYETKTAVDGDANRTVVTGNQVNINEDAMKIAYLIDNREQQIAFTSNPMDNLENMMNYVSDVDDPYLIYDDSSFELFNAYVYEDDNDSKIFAVDTANEYYLIKKIVVQSDDPLYLYIPNHCETVFQLDVDGVWQARIGGSHTSLVYVGTYKKGTEISIKLRPNEDYISYDSTTLFHIKSEKISAMAQKLRSNGEIAMNVDGNHVSIQCSAQKNMILFTTIPYDSGWKVTVNGKTVQPEVYQNAVMMIPVSEGNNSIEMTYIPQGLYSGLALSILSLTALIIMLLLSRKKVHQTNE